MDVRRFPNPAEETLKGLRTLTYWFIHNSIRILEVETESYKGLDLKNKDYDQASMKSSNILVMCPLCKVLLGRSMQLVLWIGEQDIRQLFRLYIYVFYFSNFYIVHKVPYLVELGIREVYFGEVLRWAGSLAAGNMDVTFPILIIPDTPILS